MTSSGSNPPAPKRSDRPGLIRSLGQFFGHIVQGVKSEPGGQAQTPADTGAPSQSVVIRHEVDERTLPTTSGVVRLRRTVIDEVELDRDGVPPEPRKED